MKIYEDEQKENDYKQMLNDMEAKYSLNDYEKMDIESD